MGNVTLLGWRALRDQRCKNDEAVIARALEGTWRDEHLFELRQAYELYRTYQMKVTECDGQIEQVLAKLGPVGRCQAATQGEKVPSQTEHPAV